MCAKISSINLKDTTLENLKSLKFILNCNTYDEVFSCLLIRSGLNESVNEIKKIRRDFPNRVKETTKQTMLELKQRAIENGTSISQEAIMLQKEVVEKFNNLK